MSIVVTNVTSRDFSIQWLPPVPSDRNGELRGYAITLTDEVSGVATPFAVGGNVTSLEFWDLHPAYTYILAIAAVTVSQGPFSDPMRITMDENGEHNIE